VNGLKEIKLLGRQYTWANNLPDPTFEKLDRVLVTSEWDQAFPLAVVIGMNRDISDHVHLLLKYGATPPHSKSFRYENCWMEREGLDGVVCNQLSEEDRQSLIKPFSLEEIKEIVDDLKHDKAAGPDGFPAEFYQKFWEYIKYDLKEMLDKFHSGQLNRERLNHGVISLIPKVPDADVI
jgi:hypothetical protein